MLACEELTKLVDLRIGLRQVDLDVAAALGDLGGNADVVAAAAVVIEKRLAIKHAVLPGRDHRARLLLGGIKNLFRPRLRPTGAPNSANSFDMPPLAEMRRADHRREIAAEVARVAHVQRQHVEQVVAQPAGLVEFDRRDAQALLPDFGGVGIVGAMGGAADVALMRAHDGPEQPPLAGIEDRHERGEVRQMAAAVIGIVQQDHVARARRP